MAPALHGVRGGGAGARPSDSCIDGIVRNGLAQTVGCDCYGMYSIHCCQVSREATALGVSVGPLLP